VLAACALLAADATAILAAVAGARLIAGMPAGPRPGLPPGPPGGLFGGAAGLDLAPGLAIVPDLAIVFAAIIAWLAARGRYGERIPFWSEARLVVCASLCAIAAVVVLGLRLEDTAARVPAMVALLLFPAFASLGNRLAKHAMTRAGVWTLPVVVIGDGAGAAVAETVLGSDRSLGYRVVGRVDPAAVMAAPASPRLWPLLSRYHARRLLIVLDGDPDPQRQMIECALRERVPFAVLPQPRGLPAFASQSTSFLSHDATLLSFRDGLSRPLARVVKSVMDVSVAAVLLVLTSPLFLVLALAARLDGGPALFAHRRIGAGGRPFRCLKFRTMVVDADRVLAETLARDPVLAAEWKARQKLARDPRVTRLGRFLRQTSLDELPQLINVLRREMSLVGPRPIVESEVPFYGDAIAQYYATRPGLTGLWQVSGRSETTYERRVQLDVWYVNNWTVWHDVAVLLKTVPAVLGRAGAH
jgi:undecaprenyl-phosphate galactose phosphotransferase